MTTKEARKKALEIDLINVLSLLKRAKRRDSDDDQKTVNARWKCFENFAGTFFDRHAETILSMLRPPLVGSTMRLFILFIAAFWIGSWFGHWDALHGKEAGERLGKHIAEYLK